MEILNYKFCAQFNTRFAVFKTGSHQGQYHFKHGQ